MKTVIRMSMLMVVVLGATIAVAQISPKPKGMPDSKAFGKTYGEWSVAWWQWALAMPANEHPLLDVSGTDCSTGQSGPVWFLGGAFCASSAQEGCADPAHPVITRSCTIPPGTALFFPILNTEDSYVEETSYGNPGATEQNLRSAAKGSMDTSSIIQASIDGWPLQPLRICSIDTYCTPKQSPLFTYTLPNHDNLLKFIGENVADGETSQAVSDGYYVLLPPLPVGGHEITFYGAVPDWNFSLDVTYKITIAPRNNK